MCRARALVTHVAFPVGLAFAAAAYLAYGVLPVTFLGDDSALLQWGQDMLRNDFWYRFLHVGLGRETGTAPYYRPLVILSHGIDLWIWGWSAAGHRLTNLGLHFLCCLEVFWLARLLFGSNRAATWIATILFALHPVHELAIWWIAGRCDLLCSCFYLGCVLAFVLWQQSGQRRRALLCVALAAAALASKEMAYSLPLVLTMIVILGPCESELRPRIRRAWPVVAAVGLVASLTLGLRFATLPWQNTAFAFDVDGQHIVNVFYMTMRHFFFPYSVSAKALVSDHPLLVGLGVLVLAAVGATLWRRMPPASERGRSDGMSAYGPFAFSTAWVVLSCLPIIRTMNPWTLYLPSVGLCLGLGWLLGPPGNTGLRRACAIVLCTVLLASYVGQWQARRGVWRTVDATAQTYIADLKEELRQNPTTRPVFLTLPGNIGGVPVFMHFFREHLRQEMGDEAIDPVVLTRLILPACADEQRIAVSQHAQGLWELAPENPYTTFGFPEQTGYRFVVFGPGDHIDEPWGTVTLEGTNDAHHEKRARIAIASGTAAVPQGVRRLYSYSEGRLEVIELPGGL